MDHCKDFSNGQLINFLTEKRFRPLRHAFFLTGFFFLLYGGDVFQEFPAPAAYYVLTIIYCTFIGMFYLNMYVLVPVFLFRTRYLLYILFLLLLVYTGIQILGYFHANYFDAHRLHELNRRKYSESYYAIIIICASLISVSTTVKLLQRWIMDKERITELKNLTYSMELNELKNQVSPHFLFNMLNNVKALIRTNPEMASIVIMKLSEFLRYQLYENNGEKTLLASEIDFLLNFLNLEKIRKDNLQIIFENPINQTLQNTTFIPLGLFTVFVENAIKYSINTNEEATYIKIDLKVENNMLHFNCINSKSIDIPVFNNKKGGLGLANIKRRLELLYNNEHKLNITSSANEYTVNLIIPL